MTKEEKREYDRLRYLLKKDEIKAQQKEYYENNRIKKLDSCKKYVESNRHNPSVYLLPNEYYVGTTENIKSRLKTHRYKGKNVDGWVILAEFSNRKDALDLEKQYHDNGYNGRHSQNTYQ